jgi:hypothetical protein
VVIGAGVWQNANVAGAVAGILSVVLAILSLSSHGQATVHNSIWQRRKRDRLVKAHYESRSAKGPLYDFVEPLTLRDDTVASGGSDKRRELERLVLRTLRVLEMPGDQQRVGYERAAQWAASVGPLAFAAGMRVSWRDRRLPLRRFFQTYHLGIIREGSLAEPFLVANSLESWANRGRGRDDQAVWALALRDLARTYNSVVPWQRHWVVFKDAEEAGAIIGPPGGWRAAFAYVQNRLYSFRLRPWHYHQARRRLNRAASAVIQARSM